MSGLMIFTTTALIAALLFYHAYYKLKNFRKNLVSGSHVRVPDGQGDYIVGMVTEIGRDYVKVEHPINITTKPAGASPFETMAVVKYELTDLRPV